MSTPQREALTALRFNWAETPDHVWSVSPYHLDGLHEVAEEAIRNGIRDAETSPGPSPIGLVLQGRKGVGKTHLLGWVRREVQLRGGYFFLVALNTGDVFWEDIVTALRTGLMRTDDSGELQLTSLLRRICFRANTSDEVTRAISGDGVLTVNHLDAFVGAIRGLDPLTGRECGDTARALVLYASTHQSRYDIGQDYLDGIDDETAGRREWGIRPGTKPASTVAQDISRLLALTGPSVIAVDQLDTLVAKATSRIGDPDHDEPLAQELALIADGLMQLRERTRRTMSLVACLPRSWEQLREKAIDSVSDRFQTTGTLGAIADGAQGRAFVAKWLGVPYAGVGFTPPHPTWPIAPAAFGDSWEGYTPRMLLKRIVAHVETCLHGEVTELQSFDVSETEPPQQQTVTPGPEPEYFAELDRRFAELRAAADITAPLDEQTEDRVMPEYLSAALRSWITEVGNDDMTWTVEPPPKGKPAVHAAIHRTVDEELDIEEHWAFRAIAAKQTLSALHRLRNARSATGGRATADNRHLVLIRNRRWAKTLGTKTEAEVNEIIAAGGRDVKIAEDDVRTFGALTHMLTNQNYDLREWLVARRPASSSALLREILPPTSPPPSSTWPTTDPDAIGATPDRAGDEQPGPTRAGDATTVSLGSAAIGLETLRKHVVIFAGSGSGKTVLMRRIVEECALRGVSAIVLDSNNDLARLGDPWPTPPEQWGDGDEDKAREYLANTEVVVWTPGRAAGRPLSFQPLPDFATVLDDADEFNQSVEAAVATLAPYGKVNGATDKATRGKAVLREALTHYARSGSRSLPGFVELLADLPDGVSQLSSGHKIAADLSETLKAAMVNNPLLGGMGEPADPAALLTPANGKRARVSVISFIGLPSDEQRQGFVNQLQMEVFAWAKRNPAPTLGGLLVMDEAQMLAPAQSSTASLYSTIVLASQARKYGLGLLFATQAPKGLHNQITGNATTQFFGKLNSPAQISAAQSMARAKGGNLDDIGGLGVGQFYVTSEEFGFRRMRSPFCLSHHPASPLRDEEVLDRARRRAD